MGTNETSESAPVDAVVIKLDSAIAFDVGVDCDFYSTIFRTAARYWKQQEKPLKIQELEAIRRSISLIEAVFTEQVTIE